VVYERLNESTTISAQYPCTLDRSDRVPIQKYLPRSLRLMTETDSSVLYLCRDFDLIDSKWIATPRSTDGRECCGLLKLLLTCAPPCSIVVSLTCLYWCPYQVSADYICATTVLSRALFHIDFALRLALKIETAQQRTNRIQWLAWQSARPR